MIEGSNAAKETFGQFVRFVIVGLVNTGVGLALYAGFVRILGWAPQPALAASFVLGVLWNYFSHARFVFGAKGFGRLVPYALAYMVIYVSNAWALRQLLELGIDELVAQTLLAPCAAVLSFFLVARALTGKFPLFGK